MRLQQNAESTEQPRCDDPIEANTFEMLIPRSGYRWLDDAVPWRVLDDQNAKKLGGPPHMVVSDPVDGVGSFDVSARVHFPLREWPDLFCRFRDLPLNPEAILEFANRYGWIGETGMLAGISGTTRPWLPSVGISTWHEEVQAMIVAYHLWECVEKDDRRELRNYFTWHATEFDVRFTIGIHERRILPRDHPAMTDIDPRLVPLQPPWQVLGQWLVDPKNVKVLQKVGWSRFDLLGPARLAVMNLVNPRLAAYCHPRLYLDKAGNPIGHLTPVNLLGCIWLQFYLTMIGRLKLRLCTVCKKEMDVSDSRSTRMTHDHCSKSLRQRRWRMKKRLSVDKHNDSTQLII